MLVNHIDVLREACDDSADRCSIEELHGAPQNAPHHQVVQFNSGV